VSKEAFIAWFGEIRFWTGLMLSHATTSKNAPLAMVGNREAHALEAAFSARIDSLAGRTHLQSESSIHARHGTMVSQFRKERFPLMISANMKTAIRMPAVFLTTLGPNPNQGTTNSVM
jgi:hypothetical protein